MDVKAGKSELQSAKKGPSSEYSARRRTLGSDSARDYTGVERSFPLYAPGITHEIFLSYTVSLYYSQSSSIIM